MYEENNLKEFLDKKVKQYNQPSFIKDDPICIPHLFTRKQDIEIAGFFAATFAWGNRTTIINKSKGLMHLMEMQPYAFCLNHESKDLKRLLHFKHRTFNTTDLLYFIEFLKYHYTGNESLEEAFLANGLKASSVEGGLVEASLTNFHRYFFSLEHVPARTKKTYCYTRKKIKLQKIEHVSSLDGSQR